MKKLANFLVKGRIIIFVIMVLITAFCAYLFFTQTPNKDMTKYLSDDSNMKQGLTVMDNEFPPAEEVSSIRVMFENLNQNQVDSIREELLSIPYVTSVTYDKTSEKHNKEDKTLFIVNSGKDYASSEFLSIETEISTRFNGYNFTFANDDIQSTEVPLSLILTALVLAVIILLIMSESWLEPLLLLISVGFAVIINVGSNVLLPYVAEITFSIAPVIQMVLSMDYAIIILNRYRIEKQSESNKIDAMKNAISNAGGSVISSSLTTVVGLLALVFLSFKLGPELGIVLAKGVFISMLCTFAVMPTLIIAFDKALEKSKKKYPHMKANGISKISFKAKRVMPFIFVVLFIGFAITQSFTQITFTEGLTDPIAEVFDKNNPIVLLYDNEDERKIESLIKQIESHDKVDEILGYTTTLGKNCTAEEMNSAISAMGEGLSVDKSVVNMIYFTQSKSALPKITLYELISFIQNDIASNPTFAPYFNSDLTSSLNGISEFLNPETLTTPLTVTDLASTVNFDEETVKTVYVYQKALDENFKPNGMTFSQFAQFLKNDISQNPLFANFLNAEMLDMLDLFVQLSDKQTLQTSYSSDQISQFFGIEKQAVQALFLLSGKLRMTVPEVVNVLLTNETVSSMIEPEQKVQLETMQRIVYLVLGDAIVPYYQMAEIAGASQSDMKMLFTLYQTQNGLPDTWTLSLEEFLSVVANQILPNPAYANYFDEQTAKLVVSLNGILQDVISQKQYDSTQIYQLFETLSSDLSDFVGDFNFELSTTHLELLFIAYGGEHMLGKNYSISIIDFFEYLSEDFINDERFKDFFTDEIKNTLTESKSQLINAVAQMKGENYSRLVINTHLDDESQETYEFINLINNYRENNFSKKSYLIGNSAMVSEMQASFEAEYLMISLITAISIFLVVLLTFKNFLVSLLLTFLVQCGVFVTVTVIGITTGYMYYLSLLIVQSILMGATIDYGIVFCTNYKDCRKRLDVFDSLKRAYETSLHTVLTSGTILVLVLLILGMLTTSAMIKQVCITLSIGSLVAIILILLILPAIICRFDKIITKNSNK